MAAVIAAMASAPAPAATADEPPNVLLVLSDDQGITDPMSVMPRTSEFFAAGGVSYSNAYATTPLCCPSRASIFSGLYAHNHGITASDGTEFDAADTWQRLLHDSGYRTGIAGKYLNGVPASDAPSFDDTLSIERYDLPNDSRLVAQFAARFLTGMEADDERPWALVLAPHAPHWPLREMPVNPAPLPPYRPSLPEPDLSDKHPAVKTNAALYALQGLPAAGPALWDARLRELQALDESVGIVVQALETYDESENTLAIYMSDNGFMWGEHGLFHKLWPYPESIRVPLYVRWPGHAPSGSVDERLAANIDIAPTVLAAAGIDSDYPLDGLSLLSGRKREVLLAELPDGFNSAATGRIPRWSALIEPTRFRVEWGGGFIERYALRLDPNLHSARQGSHRSALLKALRRCRGMSCRSPLPGN